MPYFVIRKKRWKFYSNLTLIPEEIKDIDYKDLSHHFSRLHKNFWKSKDGITKIYRAEMITPKKVGDSF